MGSFKASTGKIIGGICAGVFIVVAVGLCVVSDVKGITINNNHLYLHQLKDYKTIIESNIRPTVFASSEELNSHFKYVLTDNYTFRMSDIGQNIDLKYKYVYDEDELVDALYSINESAEKSQDAYIDVKTETIVPEVYGNEIDVDAVISEVKNGKQIELSDYYIKPERLSEDLKKDIEFLNDYRNWHVAYFDSDIVITAPAELITIDKNGVVRTGSASFIDDYLDSIYEEFTTIGSAREFVNHNGETVVVKGGTFGNKVNIEAEKAALVNMFKSKESMDGRVPEYEVDMGGLNGNYVEVSIPDQHVWYYEDGVAVMDSDCVTGCVSAHNNTPTGWYYLDIVDTNRMLKPKGATHGSHVDRWMRFTKDGCGLHDASWRSSFGGNIYQYNGSHGCVNLPKQFAYELYKKAYVGLPVVVY